MAGLYEALSAYVKTDAYPYHMPGHKRNTGVVSFDDPFSFDITEIDGFDNLHHAEGILRECMENAARIYGSKKSYFLVNGSSCGLLAAISACVPRGGTIAAARNCHKAAYHGMLLRQLETVYLWPKAVPGWSFLGGVTPDTVEEALTDHGALAVLITSPTYEGICLDVRAIAEIAHKHGAVLIVDSAHGAHFPFGASAGFPESALCQGADVVIESLHKTLPSLTQTAILHVGSDRVSIEKLEYFLQVYQTSSPSYVLMASIDSCIRQMASEEGARLMEEYGAAVKALREEIEEIPGVELLGISHALAAGGVDFDKGKLAISVANMTGPMLYEALREEYKLQPEMETRGSVLMMTAPGDTPEGYERLVEALRGLSTKYTKECGKTLENKGETGDIGPENAGYPRTRAAFCMADAMEVDKERCLLMTGTGCVSGEFVYVYPPGIPVLVPGEVITEEILDVLKGYQEEGFRLQGMEDFEGQWIRVLREEQHG